MKQLQFRNYSYVFKPSWMGALTTLLCVLLFIKFGLWQYNKAVQKQNIHMAYDKAATGEAINFPLSKLDKNAINSWKFKKVVVTGIYDTRYQYLLDNQVEGTQAGYHVISPLKIENSSQFVLINRGWILGKNTHTDLPEFKTPIGKQVVVGQVWVPSAKIFSLENKNDSTQRFKNNNPVLPMVWQNMDMIKYQQMVPFSVSPLLIKLDQHSQAGGFIRNWQIPAERITTNMGYAYQWFGFALASILIFFYMSITKVMSSNNQKQDVHPS